MLPGHENRPTGSEPACEGSTARSSAQTSCPGAEEPSVRALPPHLSEGLLLSVSKQHKEIWKLPALTLLLLFTPLLTAVI